MTHTNRITRFLISASIAGMLVGFATFAARGQDKPPVSVATNDVNELPSITTFKILSGYPQAQTYMKLVVWDASTPDPKQPTLTLDDKGVLRVRIGGKLPPQFGNGIITRVVVYTDAWAGIEGLWLN